MDVSCRSEAGGRMVSLVAGQESRGPWLIDQGTEAELEEVEAIDEVEKFLSRKLDECL